MVLPDASLVAYYLIKKLAGLIDGLAVRTDRMLENLGYLRGVIFSQPVLLALVATGMTREKAYRVVQRDARLAWEENRSFREVLEEDDEVGLSPEQLEEAFSLGRSLRHAGRAVDALDDLEVGK